MNYYHASKSLFEEFKNDNAPNFGAFEAGPGVYLTNNLETAYDYIFGFSKVYPKNQANFQVHENSFVNLYEVSLSDKIKIIRGDQPLPSEITKELAASAKINGVAENAKWELESGTSRTIEEKLLFIKEAGYHGGHLNTTHDQRIITEGLRKLGYGGIQVKGTKYWLNHELVIFDPSDINIKTITPHVLEPTTLPENASYVVDRVGHPIYKLPPLEVSNKKRTIQKQNIPKEPPVPVNYSNDLDKMEEATENLIKRKGSNQPKFKIDTEEVLENIIKTKTGKTLLGATAISAGLLYFNKHRKRIKASRHPRMRVTKEDMDTAHYNRNFHRSLQIPLGMGLATGAGAIGLTRNHSSLATNMTFYSSYAAGMMLSDMSKGVPADKAMIATAGSIGAGLLAHNIGSKTIPLGLKSLGTFITTNVRDDFNENVMKAVNHLRKVSPFLAKVLSSEGAGIAAAIGAAPVAHSLIGKLLNFHKTKYQNKDVDVVGEGPTYHNQAGQRRHQEPVQQQKAIDLNAVLNMSSSIRTHYNMDAINQLI